MVDDGSGKVEVWRIEDFADVAIDPAMYGQFYAGDSYIVQYTYKEGNKEAYILYFWLGSQSTQDEKGAAALLTKTKDDSLGGAATQVLRPGATSIRPTASISSIGPTASISSIGPTASISSIGPTASISSICPRPPRSAPDLAAGARGAGAGARALSAPLQGQDGRAQRRQGLGLLQQRRWRLLRHRRRLALPHQGHRRVQHQGLAGAQPPPSPSPPLPPPPSGVHTRPSGRAASRRAAAAPSRPAPAAPLGRA